MGGWERARASPAGVAGLILALTVSESHWRIRFVCLLDREFDGRMHSGDQGPERSKARRVLPDIER